MTISIFYSVKELCSIRFPWRVAFAKFSVEAPVEARVEEYRCSLWNKSLSHVRHRSYLECQQNYVLWSLCLWWEWICMLYIGRKRLKYDSLNAGHEFNNNFKMNGLCVPQQKLHSCFNSLIRTRKRKKTKTKQQTSVFLWLLFIYLGAEIWEMPILGICECLSPPCGALLVLLLNRIFKYIFPFLQFKLRASCIKPL